MPEIFRYGVYLFHSRVGMVASSCRPSPKSLGEGLSANMRLVPKNSWHDYIEFFSIRVQCHKDLRN